MQEEKDYELKLNLNKVKIAPIDNKNIDCIMNKSKIFQSTLMKFYTCHKCIEDLQYREEDKICEACYLKCHRDHNNNSVAQATLFSLLTTQCACAAAGHTDDSIQEQKKKCCFDQLMKSLKIDFLVKLTPLKEKDEFFLIICYGCFSGCYPNKLEGYDHEFIEKTEELACACEVCNQQITNGDLNLMKIIENNRKETNINLSKLFKHFTEPEDPSLCTSYLQQQDTLKSTYETPIIDTLSSLGNFDKADVFNQKFKSNITKFLLYEKGIRINKINMSFELLPKDQLISLCQKYLNLPRNTNANAFGMNEDTKETIISLRYFMLFFVRQLIIKPSQKTKSIFSQLSNVNNSTPFHRQIFRMKYDTFIQNVERYGFENIKGFMTKLFMGTRFYITKETNSMSLLKYIKEIFKWAIMFVSLDYTSSSLTKDERKKLFDIIISSVNGIGYALRNERSHVVSGQNYDQKILKYMEKFFKTFFIQYNDERFFEYISSESRLKFDNDNDLSDLKLFFDKPVIRKPGQKLSEKKRIQAFTVLFFARKSSVHVSQEIYDLLLGYEDSYITNLKSLLHFDDKTIEEGLMSMSNRCAIIKKRQLDILNVKSSSSSLSVCIDQYFNTDLSPEQFLVNVKMALSEIEKIVLHSSNKNSLLNKEEEQLRQIKETFFNMLFTVYRFINQDPYLTMKASKKDIEEISLKILELLSNYFGSCFILPYFFTRRSIKHLSHINFRSRKQYLSDNELDFYEKGIDKCIEMNYHMDLCDITGLILGEEEEEEESQRAEDDDDKDIPMKIRKLTIMKKILTICSKESMMEINNLAVIYLHHLKYIDYLRIGILFYKTEEKKTLYLCILEVLNSLNDYHYLLIPEHFPISQLLSSLLTLTMQLCTESPEMKLVVDKQLIIVTMAINRFYCLSPFKIYDSWNRLINVTNYDWTLNDFVQTKLSDFKAVKNDNLTSSGFANLLKTNTITRYNSAVIETDYVTLEKKINLLIVNLEKFQTHFIGIEDKGTALFNHFEQVILLPSIYLLYDILYFFHDKTSKVKYLSFKIVYLFFHCYKHFLSLINKHFLPSSHKELKLTAMTFASGLYLMNSEDLTALHLKLLFDTFVIKNKNEDLEIFFQNIHDCLELDIIAIEKDALNIQVILTKFVKYLIFLKKGEFVDTSNLKETIFFAFQNQKQQVIASNDSEIASEKIISVKAKINWFTEKYMEKKKSEKDSFIIDYIENNQEEEEEIIQAIVKDLVNRLTIDQSERSYNNRFFSQFDYFNKIFIADPSLFQNYILGEKLQNHMIENVKSQLLLIYQLTMSDYHKLHHTHIQPKYVAVDIFVSLLEFYRLLCENHNQYFQKMLAVEDLGNYKLKNAACLNVIDLILQLAPQACDNYKQYIQRQDIGNFFKKNSFDYFKPFITKVTDLKIEIIQGSTAMNQIVDGRSNQTFNHCFGIYLDSAVQAFESSEDSSNIFYLSEFLNFFVNLLEENSTEEDKKRELINYFNPNKIIVFLISRTKSLYDSLCQKNNKPNTKLTTDEIKYKSDYFVKIYMDELQKAYVEDYQVFKDYDSFKIAKNSLKFLEIAQMYSNNSKIKTLMDEVKTSLNAVPIDENEIWKKVTFKFFYTIMKKVELSVDFNYLVKLGTPSTEEQRSKKQAQITNIYLVRPELLLLGKQDYKKFENIAPYEDENKKLFFMIDYCKVLRKTIEKRLQTKDMNMLFKVLSKVNYLTTVKISAAFATLTALLILLSSRYQVNQIDSANPGMGITDENSTRLERNGDWIFYINLIHLLFLFSVFCNWLIFNDAITKSATSLLPKIEFKQITDSFPMKLIIWSFIWGSIAIIFPFWHFAYSLQLFVFFGLFDTMMTVIVSVKMRYKQFLSAGLLILIFSLIFSAVKFYWFCDDVSEECQHYLHCFLSLLTNGIRAGNGIGIAMKSITEPMYFQDFVLEWLFYFTVILILLNVINGIIVDTFQEQRQKNNEKNDARENICYICNTNRAYFEKIGVNYEDHVEHKHSLSNYFEYFLSLSMTNEQDLNSIDSSIVKQINEKQTGFFPKIKE